MRNYISTPAKDLFIQLSTKDLHNAVLYNIEGSEEPEGVIVFSTGQKFYFSRNPMTKGWSLDTFEMFDESLGNELLKSENQDEVRNVLNDLLK